MTDIFSKYVMKNEDKSEVFHSSAYGRSQNGASMGAASTESFEARRNKDNSRQFIRGYGDSKIAASSRSFGPRPAQYIKPATQNPSHPVAARQPIQRPPMPTNPGIHR